MLEEKILGVLGMAAIGDAMGAATENKSFDQIRTAFNGRVTTFLKPGEGAFALGNEAGQVTDDFSQIYFMSKKIIENQGELNEDIIIQAILEWSNVSWYFDRFAGPTTRSAVAMYKSPEKKMKALPGAVAVDYASKATNGAAMKIAPAGILYPNAIEKSIQAALIITKVTHNNSLAISGACAVAAATSAAMAENATWESMLSAGIYGAVRGEALGKAESIEVAGAAVVERIKLAYTIVNGSGTKEEKLRKLALVVGSGLHVSEAVPCAFGIIMLNTDNPLEAVVDAVNIGYDTDTIACIVGTMVGAFTTVQNERFKSLLQIVEQANKWDIYQLAHDLKAVVEKNEGKTD